MANPEPLIPLDEPFRRARRRAWRRVRYRPSDPAHHRRARRVWLYFPLGVPTPPPVGQGAAFCVGTTAFCVGTTAFID